MEVESTGAGGVGKDVSLVDAAAGQKAPDSSLLSDQQLERLRVQAQPTAALVVARVACCTAARVAAIRVRAQLLAKTPFRAFVTICHQTPD